MKKLTVYLVAILSLAWIGCSKEDVFETYPDLKFRISVSDLESQTRAVKKNWVEGDVLSLWFSPVTQCQPDLTLTFDGKEWKAGALRKGCELEEKGTFHVVYSWRNGIPSYANSFEKGIAFYLNQPDYKSNMTTKEGTRFTFSDLHAYCENVEYKFKYDILTASIDNWQYLTDFQVTLTDVPKNGEYALQCKTDKGYLAACFGFQLTSENGGSVAMNGYDVESFAATSSNKGEVVFHFARVNDIDVSSVVSFVLIPKINGVYSLDNALTYSAGEKKLKKAGKLQAVTMPYTKFAKVPDAVDLGLSVKWSSFNLGATIPGEYGYQYSYGELEPRDEYYWNTYSLCLEAYDKLIKYCPTDKEKYWGGYGDPDGKTVLDLSDDVVNVKLGGKWRMPTYSEWMELIDKCSWMWDTQYGLNGYTVTSKSTNKSIFLPAVGYQHSTTPSGIGSYGYYWSSSLDTEAPYNAWYLYFNAERRNMLTDAGYRYLGFSIRPVSD